MSNEQTEKTDTAGKEDNKPLETAEKPISIVDEAREIRNQIIQEKENLKEEREKLEKVQSEALLGGTSGGNVKVETKEETPEEYAKRVMSGDLTNEN